MAGQSDAADDLISELAKLMAQDAKPERPREPASPAFTVRIPGQDNPPVKPRPDLDAPSASPASPPPPVSTPPAALAVASPSVQPPPVAPRPAPELAASAPKPAAPVETPEPFRFDFDLGTARSPAPSLAPQGPVSPVASRADSPVPPAMAAVSTVDHDSIADLIAAELSADPAPSYTPAPPRATPPAAPIVPEPRPAQPTPSWQTAPAAATRDDRARLEPSAPTFAPQPAPSVEPDAFKVPPVFGLGSKPASDAPSIATTSPVSPLGADREPAPVMRQPAPPPSVDLTSVRVPDDGLGNDPIDEIENLIGRAMRVELDTEGTRDTLEEPESEASAASPALRRLATPVVAAPPQKGHNRTLSGADEAILAAAEATGAEIGWVDTPPVRDREEAVAVRPRRSFQPPRLSRAVVGPLVALGLLLVAGFGLYWVLGLSRDSGPAPLLTADATPIKETPEVQPNAAPPQSVVFNEIDGVVPGADEQLVSRDQADVNEVTQVPPPVSQLSEEGLANRKVRTVTVRPDGTIVSGEDSVAGSAILPVDRPNVPTVPGADSVAPELLTSTNSAQPFQAATAPTPAGTTLPDAAVDTPVAPAAAAPVVPVTPGSLVPAVDAQGNALAGKTAPVPMGRPAAGLQGTAPSVPSPVTAVVDTAGSGNLLPPPPANSTLGATAAQPAPAQSGASAAIPGAVEVDAIANTAPAYAQLASLRSEAEARQTAQALVNRFGPIFGGANMEVQRVDLGARGIYYRVRVPASSVQAAATLCNNVKAAGGDCVAM